MDTQRLGSLSGGGVRVPDEPLRRKSGQKKKKNLAGEKGNPNGHPSDFNDKRFEVAIICV